jgi:hypothetical protein
MYPIAVPWIGKVVIPIAARVLETAAAEAVDVLLAKPAVLAALTAAVPGVMAAAAVVVVEAATRSLLARYHCSSPNDSLSPFSTTPFP